MLEFDYISKLNIQSRHIQQLHRKKQNMAKCHGKFCSVTSAKVHQFFFIGDGNPTFRESYRNPSKADDHPYHNLSWSASRPRLNTSEGRNIPDRCFQGGQGQFSWPQNWQIPNTPYHRCILYYEISVPEKKALNICSERWVPQFDPNLFQRLWCLVVYWLQYMGRQHLKKWLIRTAHLESVWNGCAFAHGQMEYSKPSSSSFVLPCLSWCKRFVRDSKPNRRAL